MLIAAFALGIAGLTFFFDGVLERQQNPNANPASSLDETGTREVRLQRNRQGHYVSSGLINGHPVTFLLDTGATVVSIPAATANQIGLVRGREGIAMTANGAARVYGTTLDSLQIGNIQLRDVNASIMEQMPEGPVLLGMSALGEIDFRQQGSELTLRLARQ